jgi:signal transduction histidine kinase
MLLVGVPLNQANGQLQGTVLINAPLSGFNSFLSRIYWYIAASGAVVVLITIFIANYLSTGIIRPLKSMQAVASAMAGGDYSVQAKVETNDEVSDLSQSLNLLVKALNDFVSKTEKTDKLRRDFVANVSHELRTPLTSINGFVQGILDGIVTEEKQKDCLEIIKEESSRLIGLTSEIIDLAKLQSGNVKLNIVDLNLNAEVDKTVSSLSFADSDKQICISNLVDTDIFVFADKDRLKQILINLLSNSIKYSKDSINIEITAEKHDRSVKISVKDNGPGVNELDLPFLFDKFYVNEVWVNIHPGP